MVALLVLVGSNLGYIARNSVERCYFLAQRREQSNIVAEVPVQSLIDYITQIALYRGQMHANQGFP
jgi:hypothetical protein